MSLYNPLNIAKTLSIASISLICGFVVYKTIKIYLLVRKYRNIPGSPEQKGLKGFYLGNLPNLLDAKKNGKHMAAYFSQELEKYGPTCKIRLFDRMAIVTCDPNFVKEIFIDQNYLKSENMYNLIAFPFGKRFTGNGVGTEINHETWKIHRAFLNPGFQKQSLMSYLNEFNEKSDILVSYLKKFADGKTKVSLLEEFNRAALDIIASVGFGMNIDSINDRDNKLCEHVKKSFEGIQLLLENPNVVYNPFMWSSISEYKKSMNKLRSLGRDQINKRIEEMKKGENVANDIITTILVNSTKEKVDIEELVDDFVTFFFAGQETTATTLSLAFRELCRNPDVLKKTREEVENILGSKTTLEYQDLNDLKYTGAVFKETLRMYSIVPMLFRLSSMDYKTEKFTIPKNSMIFSSTYHSSRSEEFFPEPLKFKPERFLKDTENSTNSSIYTYYPFSLGPRNCIGQNFAHMEGKIMIAKMLQNFDFKLDPNERLEEILKVTLQPIDGTVCFLTLR